MQYSVITAAIRLTNAQIPSDLKRMGFNGPVRTVKWEEEMYNWEDSGFITAVDNSERYSIPSFWYT